MLLSYSINKDTINKYILDISSIEELNTMYNYIVFLYRKLGNSQQTRLSMKSIFMTFEFYVDNIVKKLKMALPKVSDSLNINSFKNAISFYEILYNQLKNGVFVEISRDDIIKLQNGRDYRQPAAPLFSPHAPTFDVPSANIVSQTQPITQPIIQEPAITDYNTRTNTITCYYTRTNTITRAG
jgi:hypothetical protein